MEKGVRTELSTRVTFYLFFKSSFPSPQKGMNFVHENYKKLNLVEFNVNKKRKIKFYYKWRDAFLYNRKCFDSKVDSLKILRILMGSK